MQPAPTQIVHGGTPRLDELLRFVEYAGKPRPLLRFLDEAPARLSRIMAADVCSIYLREGDGKALVLRGNVGFPRRALGHVRLGLGEGITGKVVELGRPISIPSANEHGAYRHFQELGEERFPVFLAAPICGKNGIAGALVVQRRQGAPSWDAHDVERLTLLGSLVHAALRTAELLDDARTRGDDRRRIGGGTRRVTLTGHPWVAGQALGACAALRRPAARSSTKLDPPQYVSGAEYERAAQELGQQVRALQTRAAQLGVDDQAAFLHTYQQILEDARFRERAFELHHEGKSMATALLQVAREANKYAMQSGGVMEERARDIEDLAMALVMRIEGDKRAELPKNSVLLGDELSVFDLVETAKAAPVGVVLSEHAQQGRSRVLAQLLGLPCVIAVEGLFKWAADGDLCLVDGHHGFVLLNPSRANVANYRRAKAQLRDSES